MRTAGDPRSTPSSFSSCNWCSSSRDCAPSANSCKWGPIGSACADSLGYDLTESLPDHSSLTPIRERYGLEVFRRFFERIVERCLAAGLVWGQELFIDATKVAANAALDSLQPRFAVEAHLHRRFAVAEDDSDGGAGSGTGGEGGDDPAPLPVELTEEAQGELAERAAQRHDWIGRAGRPDRSMTSGTYRRTADFRV